MSGAAKVARLAANDLRLTVRDRAALIWMLLLPLAFMWFFGQLGRSSEGRPKVVLQWENHDEGWLGEAFLAELAGENLKLEEVAAGAEDERTRTLVIPAGFTSGVLAGEKQTLQLVNEAGSDERYGVAAQMHVARVIARTLGRLAELELESRAGPTREAFAALGERPARVDLRVSTAGSGEAVPGGYAQSVPGTLTMVVLMMTMIYGGVFLAQEKQSGMLRRQATLPLTRGQIFIGKLLGRVLVAGAQAMVLLGFGRYVFGLSWGGSPLGLALVLAAYVLAAASLATLVGALAATPEQASGVGWLASMVLSALGGCWWPGEVMPRWLWNAAHVLPTAWAMDAFHALISFGKGAEAILVPAAMLLAFAGLFAALGARFLRVG